jgi:hypothetical protein
MPCRENPFVSSDAGGADRKPVVLVGLIEVATTIVIHVGCTGRRSHASAERTGPRILEKRALTSR